MPQKPIVRTTPFTYNAFQFDAANLTEATDFITNQPVGNNEVTFDENNNLIVAIGENTVNGFVYGTVYDGDYIVHIHSKWWTIIPNNDFSTDWDVVEP